MPLLWRINLFHCAWVLCILNILGKKLLSCHSIVSLYHFCYIVLFCLKCPLDLCEIIMFLLLSDHFLIRASAALEKLKLLCGEEQECSNPSNLLELYTQVLTQTWCLALLRMCVMHTFMWTWRLVDLCIFTWRSEVDVRCFLQSCSVLIFETRSLVEP